MVRVGDFTVKLVRADNKEAFKEHTGPAPDNHVYAEVEPGLDYFIRAESSRGNVRVSAKVDGVKLGHHKSWTSRDHSVYLGSWERTDGVTKTTALRFSAARVKSEGGKQSMLTGKVEVLFHERGEKIQRGDLDPENALHDLAPKELTGGSKLGGKKCVVSTKGTHVLSTKKAKRPKYKRGSHLCTITLHYCTAVGLIVNRVLGSPEPAISETRSSGTAVPLRVKVEKTKGRVKRENAGKRIKEEDYDPIEILPEVKRTRASVEAVMVDLTGNDEES